MFSVEHASSMVQLNGEGEEGGGAGEQQASCLASSKTSYGIPQVLTSIVTNKW